MEDPDLTEQEERTVVKSECHGRLHGDEFLFILYTRIPVVLPILKDKKLRLRSTTNFSLHTLIFGELYELFITITCT